MWHVLVGVTAMKFRLLAAAGLILASVSTQSFAAPVTFFGEDVNTTGDPNQAPFTNATAASNSFLSNLTGVGTETFESFATGTTAPLALSFPGAGTATLSGAGVSVVSGNDLSGRYPFSGTQYIETSSASFSVGFSSPIAAFGFYGTDIGDFGGQLTLTLTDHLGVVSTLTVPNTIGTLGSTSGSNLYFGFYDTGDTYTSIVFGNNSGGADTFGFDDMTVGSLQQVTPNATPLPAALPLFATGLGALGLLGWRRKRKSTATIAA
jgi:hypothetical protein